MRKSYVSRSGRVGGELVLYRVRFCGGLGFERGLEMLGRLSGQVLKDSGYGD